MTADTGRIAESGYRELDAGEARGLIESGEYDVIDVREPWEHERGHIPGSRLVPLARILANPAATRFRDGTIFVCQVGERSAVAAEMAVALGVRDVVNLIGGHKGWKAAGLPLETGL